MYLTQIKLAGFKSFAEPVRLVTSGRLVGIVGPNGCGKSNIIDAVRWVLGESRASELRGETLQDVIFNGSGTRKPAARASVELVFDNSAGRAAGAWSAYAEIAIRRVLGRDGVSQTTINGQAVRRRDVHDLFMGTGLGVRGYAIIGQGMINRLIEARPDDLRHYLEEAAGVTRYRERRREAEGRLRETRDNLQRVADILHELDEQLEHLERRAAQVERYRALQQEQRDLQRRVWLLHEMQAIGAQQAAAQRIRDVGVQIEAAQARLRAEEAAAQAARQVWHDAGEAVHAAQGALYAAGARVSDLESEQRHQAQTRQRLLQQQADLHRQAQQWRERCDEQRAREQAAQEQVAGMARRVTALEAEREQAAHGVPALEAGQRDAARALDAARRAADAAGREQALTAQARDTLRRQTASLAARETRLATEQASIAAPAEDALVALAQSVRAAQAQEAQAGAALAAGAAALPALEQSVQAARRSAQAREADLVTVRAELAALQTVQDSVQAGADLASWLAAAGLAQTPALWTRLRVTPGWETALEAVLQERLAALEVADLAALRTALAAAVPARVAFYDGTLPAPGATGSTQGAPATAPWPLLCDHVQVEDVRLRAVLVSWLAGVFCMDSLEQALSVRSHLQPGHCCVLPEGHVLDRAGVRLHAPDSERSGVLARQRQITALTQQAQMQSGQHAQAQQALQQAEAALRQQQGALDDARQAQAQAVKQGHQWQRELDGLEQAKARAQAMAQRLQAEMTELRAQRQAQDSEASTLAAQCEALAQRQDAALQTLRDGQQGARQAHAALEAGRDAVRTVERRLQEARHEWRSAQAAVASLEEAQRLAQAQAAQIAAALAELEPALQGLDTQPLQTALDAALVQYQACEQSLATQREQHAAAAAALKARDEARLTCERALDPLREALAQAQLAEQAARFGATQATQQLDDDGADRAALRALLAAAPAQQRAPDWLQARVKTLARRLDGMGALNLAAPDELAAARERRGFLDAQHADLTQAMQTLDDAIARIDRETRARLAECFAAANQHFSRLFPTLFDGGQARLELTGEEILDAGVRVMAQPPGKRNTTIQLLSGGEKALTAIALVFALFRLNPAPFCLLDEVDAPLDDANTERYSRLVRDMSTETQFLFISHNKIAMQMAGQLIGVTMQEEGVSRVVAVDMASAMHMADGQDADTGQSLT